MSQPMLHLNTNVSQTDWGTYLVKLTTSGEWTSQDTVRHINMLKMMLSSYPRHISGEVNVPLGCSAVKHLGNSGIFKQMKDCIASSVQSDKTS